MVYLSRKTGLFLFQFLAQIVNVHSSLNKYAVIHQFLMKGNIGFDSLYHDFVKRLAHSCNSVVSGFCVADQLSDH